MEQLMAWRIRVTHSTHFQYDSEVLASFNEARMTPLNTQDQLLVHHSMTVIPAPTLFSYKDYFGTSVESFDLHASHTSLDIVSENMVETNAFLPSKPSISWNHLDTESYRDEHYEYLRYSELVDAIGEGEDLRKYSTPLEAVERLKNSLRKRIIYTTGVTGVHTKASESWKLQKGVCQDFTHVALSHLRAARIPARYVSGYLYTGSGQIGETVIGESHSWVEAWIGYWHPVDPTNGKEVDEDHIVVAYGRDYHDVTPLKGIFTGGQSKKIVVSVSLTRVAR
jgi:transglutaminase-like putative cysteine protease